VAKLHGLDAPQRIEASGPNGGPIETEENPDYSKLTLEELLLLEAMEKKARGVADWDERLRQREEFQRKCYPGIKQPEVGPKDFRNLGFSHRRCRREAELRGDPTGSVLPMRCATRGMRKTRHIVLIRQQRRVYRIPAGPMPQLQTVQ
jgi:hypothetical protein